MTLMTKAPTATYPVYPVVAASDISRAERFYHDTLGMEVEWMEGIPGQFMAHAGGDTWLAVYETSAPHGQNTAAIFAVDDLDAVMSDLRDRGIQFAEYDMPGLKTVNGVVSMGPTRAAWFMDSEGNTLNVTEMKK